MTLLNHSWNNCLGYNKRRVQVEDAELDTVGQQLFDYVIDVASGRKVCSEEAGFHDMAIFKQGVTL